MRWWTRESSRQLLAAATIALTATVIAMPQARQLGAPVPVVLAVCGAAVLTCWLVLHLGFGLVICGCTPSGAA